MTRIGLHGVAGQMGLMLIKAITQSEKCMLTAGCDRSGSPKIGTISCMHRRFSWGGGLYVCVLSLRLALQVHTPAMPQGAGLIHPLYSMWLSTTALHGVRATMGLLPVAISHRTPVLVGTTSFSDAQHAELMEAGKQIPIILAANMSVSVIAMYELVRLASRLLGDEFDIEIFDFHPRTKR